MALHEVHKALIRIGFSEYESRAYCALLDKAPANGYEVARHSGVPRSKVYECLERLVARGAAARVESGDVKAKVFAPTDPQVLLDSIEHDLGRALQRARTELREYQASPQSAEAFWRVTSVRDLIARARILADEAERSLHVALWAEQFREVLPNLESAVGRGVRMAMILYSPDRGIRRLEELGAAAIQHCRSKRESMPLLGRQFALVADNEKCITGSIFPDGDVEGAYTMNRGLVTNALDLVNHEIYVERILSEVGPPVWDRYGKTLDRLSSFDRPRKIEALKKEA